MSSSSGSDSSDSSDADTDSDEELVITSDMEYEEKVYIKKLIEKRRKSKFCISNVLILFHGVHSDLIKTGG